MEDGDHAKAKAYVAQVLDRMAAVRELGDHPLDLAANRLAGGNDDLW